ncbi:MAG: hypothetical protein L3K08_05330 [Thermoplasmata archaeon]|jgi:hypothetical protein|nr:hypothetical protein [Thermoplasmata archaeon]
MFTNLLVLGDEGLTVGFWQGLTIFLLVFAIFLILAGLFTSYFGSGKSRTIGVVLLVVGVLVGVGMGYWYYSMFHTGDDIHLTILIWEAFLVLLTAVLGAVAAIAIFLVAIMKS